MIAAGKLQTLEQIRLKWRKRGREDDDPECAAEIMANLRTHIGMGEEDIQILESLDCSPSELRSLKEQLYHREVNQITKRPAEETFLEYKWRMDAVIQKLDEITGGAHKARQFNAAMGAQKAKAQILDDVLNRGQDMGVIPRAAKRTEVVGGLVVAHLDGNELLEAIKSATASTVRMIESYSTGPIGELSMDDLYFEDATPEGPELIVVKEAPPKAPSKAPSKAPAPGGTKMVGAGKVTRVKAK